MRTRWQPARCRLAASNKHKHKQTRRPHSGEPAEEQKGPRKQKPTRTGKQRRERIATKHCTVSLWRLPAGNCTSTVTDPAWHGGAGWPVGSKLLRPAACYNFPCAQDPYLLDRLVLAMLYPCHVHSQPIHMLRAGYPCKGARSDTTLTGSSCQRAGFDT